MEVADVERWMQSAECGAARQAAQGCASAARDTAVRESIDATRNHVVNMGHNGRVSMAPPTHGPPLRRPHALEPT